MVATPIACANASHPPAGVETGQNDQLGLTPKTLRNALQYARFADAWASMQFYKPMPVEGVIEACHRFMREKATPPDRRSYCGQRHPSQSARRARAGR